MCRPHPNKRAMPPLCKAPNAAHGPSCAVCCASPGTPPRGGTARRGCPPARRQTAACARRPTRRARRVRNREQRCCCRRRGAAACGGGGSRAGRGRLWNAAESMEGKGRSEEKVGAGGRGTAAGSERHGSRRSVRTFYMPTLASNRQSCPLTTRLQVPDGRCPHTQHDKHARPPARAHTLQVRYTRYAGSTRAKLYSERIMRICVVSAGPHGRGSHDPGSCCGGMRRPPVRVCVCVCVAFHSVMDHKTASGVSCVRKLLPVSRGCNLCACPVPADADAAPLRTRPTPRVQHLRCP